MEIDALAFGTYHVGESLKISKILNLKIKVLKLVVCQ